MANLTLLFNFQYSRPWSAQTFNFLPDTNFSSCLVSAEVQRFFSNKFSRRGALSPPLPSLPPTLVHPRHCRPSPLQTFAIQTAGPQGSGLPLLWPVESRDTMTDWPSPWQLVCWPSLCLLAPGDFLWFTGHCPLSTWLARSTLLWLCRRCNLGYFSVIWIAHLVSWWHCLFRNHWLHNKGMKYPAFFFFLCRKCENMSRSQILMAPWRFSDTLFFGWWITYYLWHDLCAAGNEIYIHPTQGWLLGPSAHYLLHTSLVAKCMG